MPIERDEKGGATSFTGEAVRTYQLLALKSALHLFEKTGMRPNRHVKPLQMAQQLTGVKGRNYPKLYAALDALIAQSRAIDNARLIAAAPDLLDALGNCLALVALKYGNLDADANEIQARARAAIKKARGE